jgi:hypothetical protein
MLGAISPNINPHDLPLQEFFKFWSWIAVMDMCKWLPEKFSFVLEQIEFEGVHKWLGKLVNAEGWQIRDFDSELFEGISLKVQGSMPLTDREVINFFLQREKEGIKKRLGVGFKFKDEVDFLYLFARYDELLKDYKKIKRRHDADFKEYMESNRNHTRAKWREKWSIVARALYERLPCHLLERFADPDEPKAATVAQLHLAEEYNISPSNLERRILPHARQVNNQSTKKRRTSKHRNDVRRK